MHRSRLIPQQRGDFNYVNIVLLLVVAAIGVGIYIYGPGIYKSFNLGHFCEGQAVRATEMSDMEIHQNVLAEAKNLEIEMGTFQLEISRHDNKMVFKFQFDRQIKIPGLTNKSVTFKKTVEKEYGDVMHIEHKDIKKYN